MSRYALILAVLAVFALPACEVTGGLITDAEDYAVDFFGREEVKLEEKSYAAADYLESRMSGFIDQSASISMEELTLEGEPAVSSDLGKIVPQQVSERLRQLGYNIKPPDWVEKGTFILGGTYDITDDFAEVNLMMRNAASGKVVGEFSYKMKPTREIQRLAAPRPRILRVSE